VLSIWDYALGTAKATDANRLPEPTGVRDQLTGRDYGRTLWTQQKQGVLRLLGKA
jgi:hypothetical protein